MQARVLVVDDRATLRALLADELAEAGFRVCEAGDGREAWRRFQHEPPDLVVTDLVMPASDGLDLLARIRSHSAVPVIVFTAHASVETAVAALKAGADEFVPASEDGVEGLVERVRHCAGNLAAPRVEAPLLVGESVAMQRLRERLTALARLDEPVLLVGEPGSGRDTAAQSLHHQAGAGTPFVRVGPGDPQPGALPLRGTLYLDGLDRFAPSARASYLRRVARPRDRRVGGPRLVVSVDAAEAIEALCVEGPTPQGAQVDRALLRLRRFEVRLPALREHPEDVPRIARALLERFGRELGRPGLRFDDAALSRLRQQPWPGNVAELARIVEKLVAFADAPVLRRDAVDAVLAEFRFSVAALRDRAAAREREELVSALRETDGNVTRTAEILGRSRAAVYRLVARHGVPLRRDR